MRSSIRAEPGGRGRCRAIGPVTGGSRSAAVTVQVDNSNDRRATMTLRRLAATVALIGAALCAAPAVAHADDPEFPRNGVIPAGDYRIGRGPSNVLPTPLEGCDLQVADNGTSVRLACPAFALGGRQRPVGPDETYVVFDGVPLGLALRDIDPRQGMWTGTVNVADTPVILPYPLASVWLQRR
ncbi:hypothetical protein NFA_56140 [Nocardia farcinica IFM 10152]|uniref:Uncharacterized protein n=3 Tax=Nocardia farcinica TaxID=37329 RepID=Q5YMX5_NOCFA|nr:hypothetical protein NFA_56140 [Nocardia farcinica IFM 10152]